MITTDSRFEEQVPVKSPSVSRLPGNPLLGTSILDRKERLVLVRICNGHGGYLFQTRIDHIGTPVIPIAQQQKSPEQSGLLVLLRVEIHYRKRKP